MINYRFSGHETFPCRYSWLPKAVNALKDKPKLFSDEEKAIVVLGVGKNMVRAVRFWMQATGVVEPNSSGGEGYRVTKFGELLLGKNGLDRYLEDRRTLWLLHWKLLTQKEPLFAWDYLYNHWSQPDITRTQVVDAFEREASRMDKKLSRVTLEQHFDVFLHTYVPTRGRKGKVVEDNLDCPLIELELIEKIGEKPIDSSGHETAYAFRREIKPDITPEVFIYCLYDYWRNRKSNEATLTFRDVSVEPGSIGQVFKLPEWEIRERLDSLKDDSGGLFEYRETASQQQVICHKLKDVSENELLIRIFDPTAEDFSLHEAFNDSNEQQELPLAR
jgi:hypothetical protein